MNQIEQLRTELEALQADEAELTRLQTEKETELEAMRAGKSRDFAAMAALEGQRAALSTMLAEQRAEVAQVEARIGQLEAAKNRIEALDETRRTCAHLIERREAVDTLLTELGAFVRTQIQKVTEARQVWSEELEVAQARVQDTFQLPRPDQAAKYNGNGSREEGRARVVWEDFLEEVGEVGKALLASPEAGYMGGMYLPYTFNNQENQASFGRVPVGYRLDDPVRLTLHAAEAEAVLNVPHAFRSRT